MEYFSIWGHVDPYNELDELVSDNFQKMREVGIFGLVDYYSMTENFIQYRILFIAGLDYILIC